jgi:hypothetical protein
MICGLVVMQVGRQFTQVRLQGVKQIHLLSEIRIEYWHNRNIVAIKPIDFSSVSVGEF